MQKDKVDWKQEYRVMLHREEVSSGEYVSLFLFLAALIAYSPILAIYVSVFFAIVSFCGIYFAEEKIKKLGLECEYDKK